MLGRRRSLVPLRVRTSILVGIGHLELVELLALDVSVVVGVVTKVDDDDLANVGLLDRSLLIGATLLVQGVEEVEQRVTGEDHDAKGKLDQSGTVSVLRLLTSIASLAAVLGQSGIETGRIDVAHFVSDEWRDWKACLNVQCCSAFGYGIEGKEARDNGWVMRKKRRRRRAKLDLPWALCLLKNVWVGD